MSEFKSVLEIQEGGTHYRDKGIQPIEYANANNLSFFQGNVVKYVTRYKDKKGVEDLKKAIHYLQMILEFEYSVLTDFSYSDVQDISQDELKMYVNSVVESEKEKPWYPLVEDGGNPWIEWSGMGFKPDSVSPSDVVEFLMDYERKARRFDSVQFRASSLSWRNESIVAYRVV